jgi:hypothetical protein
MKYGGQRMKTALVYLNNVDEGGGTRFTKLNKEVNAEKGKLLVFHNVHDGTHNKHELSEHAGMPVIQGEKWAFNLWFREETRKVLYKYPDVEKVEVNPNSIESKLNELIIKMESEKNGLNTIQRSDKFLSDEDISEIVSKCNFDNKDRASVWIQKTSIPGLIKRISKLVNIDSSHFENMCITKYKKGIIHRDHLDAYDLNTAKGLEYTAKTGQRLMTITGFLSTVTVQFSKLEQNYNMNIGDVLFYNNCFNESNKRNGMMTKSYSPNNEVQDYMLIFNIYVREKNSTGTDILKIKNNLLEKADNPVEPKIEVDYNEVRNNIYTNTPLDNMRIPGFKMNIKGSPEYLNDTLNKIKGLKDTSGFLQEMNIEKEYFIDEYNPVVVENVIHPEIHKIVDDYFKTNIKHGVYPLGDRQANRYKVIDEIITRLLHLEFLPLIEKITGRKMEATYTYLSAYLKGTSLPAHTDRPECEFTCSYIIGKPKDSSWNIYVHKTKQPEKYKGRYDFTPPKEECIAVDCEENGLMIFNGTDHIHFREELPYDYYNIVLLHYCSK